MSKFSASLEAADEQEAIQFYLDRAKFLARERNELDQAEEQLRRASVRLKSDVHMEKIEGKKKEIDTIRRQVQVEELIAHAKHLEAGDHDLEALRYLQQVFLAANAGPVSTVKNTICAMPNDVSQTRQGSGERKNLRLDLPEAVGLQEKIVKRIHTTLLLRVGKAKQHLKAQRWSEAQALAKSILSDTEGIDALADVYALAKEVVEDATSGRQDYQDCWKAKLRTALNGSEKARLARLMVILNDTKDDPYLASIHQEAQNAMLRLKQKPMQAASRRDGQWVQ